MRTAFLGAIVIGLLVGGAVAGVRAFNGSSTPDVPEATPTPDPASPDDVAEALAGALAAQDAARIHGMLDATSAAAVSTERIRAILDNFGAESTLVSMTAEPVSASRRGASIEVTLDTGYFGTLQYTIDASFTASLDGDLAVQWSPSLIHPELGEGDAFEAHLQHPVRGAILDRDGAPLAVTEDVRYLGLNRSIIDDRAAITAALEQFGFSRAAIDAAFDSPLGANQRVPVGVVGEDRAVAANVLVRSTTGLLLWFESQRVHPLGPAAAHVVGYTRELTAEELEGLRGEGFRAGDRIGATGLEAGLDDALAGQPGGELRIVDPGRTTSTVVASREFVPGQDVVTTLDSSVLQRSYELLGGRPGASVVMDPATNAVLALNSSPSFDPDAFERGDQAAIAAILDDPSNRLSNRATNGLYSAGSTFKLVTGAAGLSSGYYSPGDFIACPAIWDGVDPPRRNWEGGQGAITIAQGLMRSCNTLFYEIGLKLYNEAEDVLPQTARAFGFGAPTGIAGLAEEGGLVPDAAWKVENRGEPWYPGDAVNLSIGQGDLLITPLQLANAYSAFTQQALRPPVVLEGEDPGAGTPLPLTGEQHAHLLQGLKLVTGPSGTARTAFSLAGYTTFAGKSGTAEDANEQQHVLFVTFAPADAPRGLAVVVFDEGQSGSIEAAPIARDMVLEAIE